jgi:heparan-alpha-glucosaminide N-acetyltransferase
VRSLVRSCRPVPFIMNRLRYKRFVAFAPVSLSVPNDGVGARPTRLLSVDAYRGTAMFLMLAEVLRTCDVAAALPGSRFMQIVCSQQTHASWVGASLHDLIQPSFYFLVGLAVLLSVARRQVAGQRPRVIAFRTLFRAGLLILIGIALQAAGPRRWNWYFVDTLTQIGLAYPIVVALASQSPRAWWGWLVAILLCYWLWFALSPIPPSAKSWTIDITPAPQALSGFATHWQKNGNVAWQFDLWFVNLFPRETLHTGYGNGLTTLNFVPSIATMILGLLAGSLITSEVSRRARVRTLCALGVTLIGIGWMLNVLGICPVVKAIWTPSWVLFSGGWCLLILALFELSTAHRMFRYILLPFVVIGTNSIVAYAVSFIFPAFAFNTFRRLFGSDLFYAFGTAFEPMVYGSLVLSLYWLLLFGLYRRRLFFRI